MGESRKKRKKPLALQWVEYSLFRVVQSVLRRLSEKMIRRVGTGAGRLAFRLARSRTRLALENVKKSCLEVSESERESLVAACWEHFCVETMLYVRDIAAPASQLRSGASIVNDQYLGEALAEESGVILYTAHLGAWESAIALVQRFNLPFGVVARPLDNDLLEEMLSRSRRRFDVEMIPKRNAARVLMKRLARKEGVLVLPDQAVHPREGILVPFLGRPAWTTAAPARLALRYGAPLVGAFCYRREGKVIAELVKPIATKGMDNTHANVELLTRRINDEISSRIREHPSLWLWMHDRWKNVR